MPTVPRIKKNEFAVVVLLIPMYLYLYLWWCKVSVSCLSTLYLPKLWNYLSFIKISSNTCSKVTFTINYYQSQWKSLEFKSEGIWKLPTNYCNRIFSNTWAIMTTDYFNLDQVILKTLFIYAIKDLGWWQLPMMHWFFFTHFFYSLCIYTPLCI